MELKRAEDIDWQDLPSIETPFFFRSRVKQAFSDQYGKSIWGIDEVLCNRVPGCYDPGRNPQKLVRLLELLEDGDIFLVHGIGSQPFNPVVQWIADDGEDKERGRWAITPSVANSFVGSRLTSIISTVSRESRGGSAGSSLWDQAVGGAKELLNRIAAENGALNAEWFAEEGIFSYKDKATGQTLSPEEVGERYRNDSAPLLEPEGPDEMAGAQTIRDLPQTPALVGVLSALGSRGKSALRHPQELLDDLKKALTHSRSETEALGELGMHQAHRRLGIESDPRYVNRYHGPDDIGHQNKRLTETEAKGSQDDRVQVATNNGKRKQGSAKNNRLRAEKMKKKEQQGKVGQASNRQGGSYTESEMELWQEIKDLGGNKQHLLVHTNTETGLVRTFTQGDSGQIGEEIDEFKLENFEEAKTAIKEFFKK
jgi:hypothetical protein